MRPRSGLLGQHARKPTVSATSSVFGITAIRSFAHPAASRSRGRIRCTRGRSGKANGSLDRHRKQAVRLFMRNGTGSMPASSAVGGQVGDADAGAVAVALRREIETADARDPRLVGFRIGLRSTVGRRRSGSMPAPL